MKEYALIVYPSTCKEVFRTLQRFDIKDLDTGLLKEINSIYASRMSKILVFKHDKFFVLDYTDKVLYKLKAADFTYINMGRFREMHLQETSKKKQTLIEQIVEKVDKDYLPANFKESPEIYELIDEVGTEIFSLGSTDLELEITEKDFMICITGLPGTSYESWSYSYTLTSFREKLKIKKLFEVSVSYPLINFHKIISGQAIARGIKYIIPHHPSVPEKYWGHEVSSYRYEIKVRLSDDIEIPHPPVDKFQYNTSGNSMGDFYPTPNPFRQELITTRLRYHTIPEEKGVWYVISIGDIYKSKSGLNKVVKIEKRVVYYQKQDNVKLHSLPEKSFRKYIENKIFTLQTTTNK